MKLSNAECNVLDSVASSTKMDCWFFITEDKNGRPYIFDLENNKRMRIEHAVQQLMEGIEEPINYYNCRLTEKEDAILRDLAKRCGAILPPTIEESKRCFEEAYGKKN